MTTNKNQKIIGLIPARYASSRFPGKPLADICGKPMIWWVYKQAKKSKLLTEVFIATPDKVISDACSDLNIPCILNERTGLTGTDCIAEAAKKMPADLYVNIQGDEPLIDPRVIDEVIKPLLSDPSIRVAHLMSEITDMHELVSSTICKVVVNHNSEAIFISRLPVPFPKKPGAKYFKMVCVFGFKPEALVKFSNFPKGNIEQYEEIESLRFLENHIPIKMVPVKSDNIAVDTPSDLKLVQEIMRKKLKKN